MDEKRIEKQVKELRAELHAKLERRLENMKEDVLMERKDKEMKRIRGAFGIGDDFEEGRAFNFETEKQRQERLARAEEEERLRPRIRND